MAMPTDVPIIDCMISFPIEDKKKLYEFITKQTKDSQSKDEYQFPVEYMFKDVPDESKSGDDPVAVTLREMDKHNIERGLIGIGSGNSERALKEHPDRFVGAISVDPNDIMGVLRRIVEAHEKWDIRAVDIFPCGLFPQIRINAPQMYPVYAKCVELGIPVFVNAGVPGPRLKMDPQKVEYIDDVMYDFPDLVFVTRHGCEPWEDLAVKLMLKWPGLHYCTSAFAPKHYPKAIIDYANTRGADKIIYAGYFPMGLTLDRIMGDMVDVPFRDHVWPKFLQGERGARPQAEVSARLHAAQHRRRAAHAGAARRADRSGRDVRAHDRGRARRRVRGVRAAAARAWSRCCAPAPTQFGDRPYLVFPDETVTFARGARARSARSRGCSPTSTASARVTGSRSPAPTASTTRSRSWRW